MKLYLVVNTKQEEDYDYFVINICKTKDSAEKLAENYRKNFINEIELSIEEANDLIIVKEIDDSKDILWDCYNEH